MDSWLKQAREASGMTVEQCALVLCTSTDAYLDLECRPGLLRLVEVGALIRAFDEEGKRLTRAAIALCDILQFAKYRKI